MFAPLVMVVDVADSAVVDMVYATVVVKVRPVPVPAEVAESKITKPVIDATVESDVPSPIPVMEAIRTAVVAPISRSP
jgi:hypothetical protein